MNEIEKIIKNPQKILRQIKSDYLKGLDHVTSERIRKRKVNKKLLQQPTKEGSVLSRALWKTQKLWMATSSLDSIEVDFSPNGGAVASEIANNTNKVAKADYKTMGLSKVDWAVKWNVGLFGLGCKVYSGWDKLDKHPIVESVDPLTVIPDPQFMEAKDMRFIGFEKRADIYSLSEGDGFFGINEIIERKGETSQEVDLNQEALYSANNYPVSISDSGIIDIYYHYCTFEGKKYLVGTVGSREILVKIVEILPKTKAEKRDPRKIKFPVVFYRANPILGLFFGASLWDEIGQYADAQTILDNLELILARKVALGDDRFINTSIIDIKSLQGKQVGGRLIPVKLGNNDNINNSIFTVPQDNPGNLPQYTSQKLQQNLEQATPLSAGQNFGVSPEGSQTKGEINTLQQNINILLGYSVMMMMQSEVDFWELWYAHYVYNLHANSKKFITLTKGGGIKDSFDFKKKEFIVDMSVEIEVKSKAQEKLKKDQKFAKFQVIMGTILPNTEPGSYAFMEIMREYLTLGDLERDQIMRYLPYSVDELIALEGLVLLENGDKPNSPEEGQDYDIFINYYSNARDSEQKNDIMGEYIDAKKSLEKFEKEQSLLQGQLPPEGGQVDSIAQGQIGNQLASEGLGGSQNLGT